ncbi:HVA22-like protein a [Hordeum vulgare subsp. vulgare]|uniref:HVA22-like protein n=1 Tax=Hordeum vulgare subsp. vulgare TaxID=112509 RepID=M0Z437_HORVV|nr:HVA22-like protein a [Hordeum vulgare subsp. vulgare]XP_044952969.1 HVA22-like protein a [Hordeum vulgare subsp. vulgare]KAI4981952.1 hypothetical protein ZWY2020_022444 [Hordeum vulgare]
MGSGSFLKVLVSNLDVLAGPIVSLAYPLYASVRAIETKSPIDDQQWLTYWVLYSFITLFELTFAAVIEWLPFWSYGKLFFNCWLVLPYFNGAAHVYEHFVRPMIVNQQVVNIWYIPKKENSDKPDDVISAAQKYIEQNGSKAFETLVNKFKTTNARRSILEEVEVERRARAERELEARDVNPFFHPNY